MLGWTQEEIAASEDLGQRAISDILEEFQFLEKLLKSHQALPYPRAGNAL